jgi:cell division cycle 14
MHVFQYRPHGDDFGPLNLASIVDFIRALEKEFSDYPDCKIVFCVDEGRRVLTNAVFLLGAYMILKLHMQPAQVAAHFQWLDPSQVAPYRDATFHKPDFSLRLIDCWRGLARGKDHGWVQYEAEGYMWGAVDVDEYRHYDHPANGDVHQIIPGELIALPSPEEMAGDFCDGPDGRRAFSPAYIADLLRDMDVQTLVRLGPARYDASPMAARGIRVIDIPCPENCRPPDAAVAAFVRAVGAAAGAVAVHCATGRAQTGALAALHLMRAHGFTAREAMGWVRIMRPGSVVGEQQHFLCDVGDALIRLRQRAGRGKLAAAAAAGRARVAARTSLSPVPEGDGEGDFDGVGSDGGCSGAGRAVVGEPAAGSFWA